MKRKIYGLICIPFVVICLFGILYLCLKQKVRRPDIILISIDCLPKYTVTTYGYPRNITPFIDSLAKQSYVFENHIVQSPWTFTSMSSMMTSRYITEIGIENVLGEKLGDELLTLAEVLGANDYYTAASVAALPLREKFGLNQGFKKYIALPPRSDATRMTDEAINILENTPPDKKTFLWLHYFDPHCPYDAPEPYTEKYVKNYEGTVPWNCETAWRPPDYYQKINMTLRDAKYLKNRQDGEIEYTDVEIGRLFKYLKEKQQFNSSLIILMADHGEEFFEHNHKFIGHGIDFYETIINVPFIVKFPNQENQKRIVQLSRQIDIFPTLMEFLKIELEALSGSSLLPILKGKNLNLPAFSEYNGVSQYCSFQYDSYKIILGGGFGAEGIRLFDLETDPEELNNLAKTNPQLAREIKEKCDKFREGILKGNMSNQIKLSPELREKLKSLGYIK